MEIPKMRLLYRSESIKEKTLKAKVCILQTQPRSIVSHHGESVIVQLRPRKIRLLKACFLKQNAQDNGQQKQQAQL